MCTLATLRRQKLRCSIWLGIKYWIYVMHGWKHKVKGFKMWEMTKKQRKWNKKAETWTMSLEGKSIAHFNTISIHPSFPVMGSLEPIPATSGREAGYTLDESPALTWHTCLLSACVQAVLDCMLLNVCHFLPSYTTPNAPWWSQAYEL